MGICSQGRTSLTSAGHHRAKQKLKPYIAVKDEKENLKSEINALRGILENDPVVLNGTLSDLGLSLYEIFYRSKDRLSFELALLYCNFSCDPVYHSNGSVADLKFIHKGQKFYASKLNNRGSQKVLK